MEADLTLVITLGVVFQVVSVPKPQFFVGWQVQRLTKVREDQLVRISDLFLENEVNLETEKWPLMFLHPYNKI